MNIVQTQYLSILYNDCSCWHSTFKVLYTCYIDLLALPNTTVIWHLAKEKVRHLLMVRQLKPRPETMHKFPLLSDVGFLLTFNTLIDQVLECIPDAVHCWIQIFGSSSWQTLQTPTAKRSRCMHAFWPPRSDTQVMLSSKCQSQTPITPMLQQQVPFADTGWHQHAMEGSHCLFTRSHTLVISRSIKQLWTELCQKQHHGVAVTLLIPYAQFNYMNCSGY